MICMTFLMMSYMSSNYFSCFRTFIRFLIDTHMYYSIKPAAVIFFCTYSATAQNCNQAM